MLFFTIPAAQSLCRASLHTAYVCTVHMYVLYICMYCTYVHTVHMYVRYSCASYVPHAPPPSRVQLPIDKS